MTEFDLSYAPKTYWPGHRATEVARIKRSVERWAIEGFEPSSAPLLGGSPASLEAGEYLPDFEPGEVEIARIELASTLGDVYSVRAARSGKGPIRYRVVDEYDNEFEPNPSSSTRPLSFGDLTDLIDSVQVDDDFGAGLTSAFRNMALDGGSDAAKLVGFVRVSSPFYSQLEAFYQDQAERWLVELEEASFLEELEALSQEFERAVGLRAAPELNPLAMPRERTVEELTEGERAGIARWLRLSGGCHEAEIRWSPRRMPRWLHQPERAARFEVTVRVGRRSVSLRFEGSTPADRDATLPTVNQCITNLLRELETNASDTNDRPADPLGVLIQRADDAWAVGQLEAARNLFEEAELADPSGTGSLGAVADFFAATGDLQRAHELWSRIEEMARSSGTTTERRRSLERLALIAFRRDNLPAAFEHLRDCDEVD